MMCYYLSIMEKRISIADLRIDQQLTDASFALNEIEKKISKQSKPYYNLELSDKTGEIRAKIWGENIGNVDDSVKVGDIVAVTGVVQEYAGKPQLILKSLAIVKDMAPEEFLPICSRDRSTMTDDFENAIQDLKNPYLKNLLLTFWENPYYKDRFINYPAGEYVHHGYVGGLLEHTWEMYQLSKPYFMLYPQMNWDIFFAGLFFHDIGKIEELDIVGATIIRTTAGKLVAHIGQGLLLVDRLVREVPDFPEDLKNKLYHLILSHQGDLDKGSPIVPQTLEGIVLSLVDNSGAAMNQAAKHIEKNLDTGEEFTEFHKWLKRSLYQKDLLSDSLGGSEQGSLPLPTF
jgi:3'-5' exoribonuclease